MYLTKFQTNYQNLMVSSMEYLFRSFCLAIDQKIEPKSHLLAYSFVPSLALRPIHCQSHNHHSHRQECIHPSNYPYLSTLILWTAPSEHVIESIAILVCNIW